MRALKFLAELVGAGFVFALVGFGCLIIYVLSN